MSAPRCLFALSTDFGEFVTANILSRGQPLERRFALPTRLAPFARGLDGAAPYASVSELQGMIEDQRPDVVVLSSGYLFAINGLFGPEALASLVAELQARRVAVATTDPWLRLRALRPQTRFFIRSIRRGGIDAAQTHKVLELQRRLEAILGQLPHLLAVPSHLAHAAFNPGFAGPPAPAQDEDEWLFVLSREDLALLAQESFFEALQARIGELLAVARNRLRFVGPAPLGRFLEEKFPGERRIEHLAFCDFQAFETAVLRARVVAYWNVLSASSLYCLYHGVAPVFFAKGHQANVCEGLYEHAVAHVYRGRPPPQLALERPFEPDATALVARLGIYAWLDALREQYAQLPQPAQVLEALCSR